MSETLNHYLFYSLFNDFIVRISPAIPNHYYQNYLIKYFVNDLVMVCN